MKTSQGSQTTTYMPHVDCSVVRSNLDYGIIQLRKHQINFFPGYRVQFLLETIVRDQIKDFVMHLTGSQADTSIGEVSGGYLCHPRPSEITQVMQRLCPDSTDRELGSFANFYSAHPEIVPRTILRVTRIDQDKYRVLILP